MKSIQSEARLIATIADLKAEISRLRPQKLKCKDCEEWMIKSSMPEIEDDGDCVMITETWYCPNCVELRIEAPKSLEEH